MKRHFQYKGYFGSEEVNVVDNILYGKLLFINDIVTYVADSPEKLKVAFEEAVDDYLQTCAELGDEPNAPYTPDAALSNQAKIPSVRNVAETGP
ncbi:MAG: type II toxin-antitoxin system HicB family antitoxin [Candidatus Methylumidiphilus sp.]